MSTKVNQQKKLVYKPRINGNTVIYRNSRGQTVKTVFADAQLNLPKALNQSVSGKKPNVTKFDLKEALWHNTDQLFLAGNKPECLEVAERLIDHYAEKISEGEAKGIITQKEQFEIMEFWDQFFKYNRF